MARPKREGQHVVKALIRVYSRQGVAAIDEMLSKDIHENSRYVVHEQGSFTLVDVLWCPRPSKNEWNTESDWRREIARAMTGLYYDVLVFEPSWHPINEPW